jgi:RNA polymerase-binding transcription factor DksA
MPKYSAIRQELQDKLEQLVARAGTIEHDLSETPNEDWEDRATEMEEEEVLSAVGNVTLTEIGQIKHALHQIDSGTYGTCERCGDSIPRARLEALPYATTCTRCA